MSGQPEAYASRNSSRHIRSRCTSLSRNMQLPDAPDVLQSRREETSTLQIIKALANSRAGFPTKARAKIFAIDSRSQEAQVYIDFCQSLRPFDADPSLKATPANMLSVSELVQAVRRPRETCWFRSAAVAGKNSSVYSIVLIGYTPGRRSQST